MVVMDCVDAQNACFVSRREYPEGYLEVPVAGSVMWDVKKALNVLHINGLVHGDLRRLNVLVVRRSVGEAGDEDGDMLVDFNWAGQAGEARCLSW